MTSRQLLLCRWMGCWGLQRALRHGGGKLTKRHGYGVEAPYTWNPITDSTLQSMMSKIKAHHRKTVNSLLQGNFRKEAIVCIINECSTKETKPSKFISIMNLYINYKKSDEINLIKIPPEIFLLSSFFFLLLYFSSLFASVSNISGI